MLLIKPEDRITLKQLLNNKVDGEPYIYDIDIDRFLGVHLEDKVRQQIKTGLKELLKW